MRTKLLPPLSYQGGKARIASQIVDHLLPVDGELYDLCCGCGAIAIEAVNEGVPPERIVMVDSGPWGIFWKSVADGAFDVGAFAGYIKAVPSNPASIPDHMRSLFEKPIGEDAVYVFLLLQASTFGGAAVWTDRNKWAKGGGWRSYWRPTATSNRRSVVNPMMPMPFTILERVRALVAAMKGIRAIHADIRTLSIDGHKNTVYIDPPYVGREGYGDSFDVVAVARSFGRAFVSEGFPMAVAADSYYKIESNRKKGGMNGARHRVHEEWLSEIRMAQN